MLPVNPEAIGLFGLFATVICFGLAASAAVMVGKEIGEGRDFQHVYDVAKTLLAVSVLVGAAVMALQLVLLPSFFRPILFPLFQLSPGAAAIATDLAVVYAIALPTRAFDVTNVTGVLRAGGDGQAVKGASPDDKTGGCHRAHRSFLFRGWVYDSTSPPP